MASMHALATDSGTHLTGDVHLPGDVQLLDTLWSLQYRTPGACCASAGPVLQSASCNGSSAARAAVYYRFSSQTQAERFVAGPAFASAKERLLGSGTISLSLWKVRGAAPGGDYIMV